MTVFDQIRLTSWRDEVRGQIELPLRVVLWNG